MSKPTLSVCLITYNQAQYIKEAIDSILMQKVNFAWELIIADDYSTDGTREILLEYKRKSPDFIKLILQKNNVGPEKNWLDLMARPKSKYVIYVEGDDYFTDPSKLQKQVDFLETHQDFSLCFHPVKVTYEDGSKPDEVFPSPAYRFNKNVLELKDLLARNFIQTNSAMYRWRFIEEDIKDIFPKNIAPGDWFLHILHAQDGKIGFIDECMSVYRRHPGGLWWSSHNNKYAFWEKYGLMHIAMYSEVLKLYGKNKDYENAIYEPIIRAFADLAKLSKDSDGPVLHDVITRFPDITETYLLKLDETHKRALKHENHKLELQKQEDAKLRHMIDLKENHIKNLEKELGDIKNSRIWKALQRARNLKSKSKRTEQ